MKVLRTETAPRYKRAEGITSYLLASGRTCGAEHLTITVVQIQPGGEQRIHSHPPEQVYYILAGRGSMTVASETREVQAGDCVFVPSGRLHGLKNDSSRVLEYLSAAAPAFGRAETETLWPLASERDERARTQRDRHGAT